MINEQQLENLCLDWFRETGWDVRYRPDIAPDGLNPQRNSYAQVVLNGDLEAAFTRIDTHLPADCFSQVFTKVTQPESLDLITNNHAFHRMLVEGVPSVMTK